MAVGLLAGAGLFAACSNGSEEDATSSDELGGANQMPYVTNLNPK